MPYRQKTYRTVPTNYELGRKIKRMQRETELKFQDTWVVSLNTDDPDANNQIYVLNDTGGGTAAFGERIGNEIYPTSIQWRGFVYVNYLQELPQLTDAIRAPFIRMIIFWDKACSGALPQIIGASTQGDESLLDLTLVGASPIWAPYNHSTATRFKILYDETIYFGPSSANYWYDPLAEETINQPAVPNKFVQGKIPLNRITRYTSEDPGIASISENGLFVTFISTYDGTTSSEELYGISADISFRLYFKDE